MPKSMNVPPLRPGRVKDADEVKQLSAQALAFVGDAVQSLYVRAALALSTDATGYALHRYTADIIRSQTQADAAEKMQDFLDEEELYIYRRGRNAKGGGVPDHASVAQYRMATGLEAVLGYRYLCGDTDRLDMLLKRILELSLPGEGGE
ncbi:MAG: Mini-ribonuclease 3 [Christensenellales bacterium]|jgi:ribonuclease-3 family protein